jgi:predicted type IV restriction endonuclease
MLPSSNPEAQARIEIDRQLETAGWTIQDQQQMDIFNHRAVAVREFSPTTGFADYLLIVDKKAIGVVEAKPVWRDGGYYADKELVAIATEVASIVGDVANLPAHEQRYRKAGKKHYTEKGLYR